MELSSCWLAGIIGSMVVSGFSPRAEFGILNSSPIGALIVDDLEAKEDTEVMARADGCASPRSLLAAITKLSACKFVTAAAGTLTACVRFDASLIAGLGPPPSWVTLVG
jgi:hypothetical protein